MADENEQEEGEELSVLELEDSLADVEKPPELPNGSYHGEVQDVQIRTSEKGNRYYEVTFVIPPSEIPADMQDDFPDGATMRWRRTVIPTKGNRRALYGLRTFIEALGLDSNTTQVDPNEWMGQRAKLIIRGRKYNGEMRADIAQVEAADEAPSAKRGAQRGRR